ncbi:protein-disulfide reductase DsbD [Lysobacter enzymogenes]|uniref:protein-disulfide reductase DsbD n=1 Tax=Lysobacter enzymogenes TaxID=69 RepID=UPI001AF5FF15|nr:protein-disulfide reductase DsbD [Lysobacter enzymogenes]QQQ00481.1 protein-disulfide reductase DsbD [Lysobacter enzymogenes]
MTLLSAFRGRRRLRAGAALALAVLGLSLSAPVLAVDEKDLLPVDEAFALSARSAAPDRIAISWKVAKGYYLYRHRISVKSDAGFAAQALQLPKGKAYRDQFFGDVETYHQDVAATLPGQAKAATAKLTIKYQGCADAGVCYPPQTRTVEVALAAPPAAAAGLGTGLGNGAAPAVDPAPAAAPLANFGARGSASNPLLGGGSALSAPAAGAGAGTDALPLPPERAFGFEAIAKNGDTLLLRFTPARGYYLYRDKTSLKTDRADIAAGKPQWPRGTAHRDEHFGDVTVFFDQIDVPLPLLRKTADAGKIVLTAGFQGCQTDGICYPPMTRKIEVELPRGTVSAATAATAATPASAAPAAASATTAAAAATSATPANASTTATASAPVTADAGAASVAGTDAGTAADTNATGAAAADSAEDGTTGAIAAGANPAAATAPQAAPAVAQAEDSLLAASLAGPNRYFALLTFFGFGLLLAFTPCVLPMIPILSGLIVGRGPGLGARRAFLLSLVYVLASAVVFTIAGVVAGLVGANLQIAFQTPWVIVLFALLFVALALSSFGLFELQLPHKLRSLVGEVSDRQRSGSWTGVAVMGALSALIVGPCVAPPLAAAVLYIGQTRDPLFGGAALFALAMGMGAPLLAFGVAAGKGLPTSGPWMVGVQRVFGLVFLGMAVWMLSRILPGPVALALYAAVLLGAAVLIALGGGGADRGFGLRALAWVAALLLGVAGAAQLFGALAGGHDPLQPLAGLRGGAAAHAAELPFRKIKSNEDLDREIAAAQAAGKPLMLDFYADWCVACKEMEKYTFPEPAVHRALDGFVLLKADVTANDEVDQALMKRLGVIGPPMTIYYAHGAERRELRLVGFEKAEPFARRAERARAAAGER